MVGMYLNVGGSELYSGPGRERFARDACAHFCPWAHANPFQGFSAFLVRHVRDAHSFTTSLLLNLVELDRESCTSLSTKDELARNPTMPNLEHTLSCFLQWISVSSAAALIVA